MPQPGSLEAIVAASVKYFRLMYKVHIACAGPMLGLGTAAAVMSHGSDGSGSVPYFFTAFIAGCWHLALMVISMLCCRFLSKQATLMRKAKHWVNGYTVLSSVFILFNMMGVVFSVVYGLCTDGQLCYYDHDMEVNRGITVSIMCMHTLFLVLCIFFSKRSHLVESQLHTDIGIRLGHDYMLEYFRNIHSRRRLRSTASTIGSAGSLESESSSDVDDTMQRNTFLPSNKPAHQSSSIITTIPQADIFQISKSNPNLKGRSVSLGAEDMEGTLVSIYSDCDTKKPSGAHTARKKLFRNRTRSNKVTPEKTIDDTNVFKMELIHRTAVKESDNTKHNKSLSSLECHRNGSPNRETIQKKHRRTKSVQFVSDSETDSYLAIADVNTERSQLRDVHATRAVGKMQLQLQHKQGELQRRQLEMQEKQERLLCQQERLGTLNPAVPPPYSNEGIPATRPQELKLGAINMPGPPAYEEIAGPQSIVELDTMESENGAD